MCVVTVMWLLSYVPFNGIKVTDTLSTASPGTGNESVMRGDYCFKPGNKPMGGAVPVKEALSSELVELFARAFIDDRKYPSLRPTAAEWCKELEKFEKSLVKCGNNDTHFFRKQLKTCPLCEADNKYNAALNKINQRKFTTPVVTPVMPAPQPVQITPASQPVQAAPTTQPIVAPVISAPQPNFVSTNNNVSNGSGQAAVRNVGDWKQVTVLSEGMSRLITLLGWGVFLFTVYYVLRPAIHNWSFDYKAVNIYAIDVKTFLIVAFSGIASLVFSAQCSVGGIDNLEYILVFVWGTVCSGLGAVITIMQKGLTIVGGANYIFRNFGIWFLALIAIIVIF